MPDSLPYLRMMVRARCRRALLPPLQPAAVGRAHAEAGSPLPCGGPLTVSHDCIQKDGQPLCREYREVCFDQERVISYDR